MAASIVYDRAEPLLQVEGVHLTLGGKLILRDVAFTVHNLKRPGISQGQVVGLLGPSGMGKTQLFRILSGLNIPDSGSVMVGHPLAPVQAGKVGVVAQHYPLFNHRTVIENLAVAGKQVGLSGDEARENGKQILTKFGLDGHFDKYPAQLSGGQRQRAAIAQQLVRQKSLLLMDEPFSGLDPAALEDVTRLVTEVAHMHEQNTIVVVTHDIRAALCVSDALLMLGRDRDEGGRLKGDGAKIQAVYDLVGRGLAWRQDVEELPEFGPLERELKARFRSL